MTASQIALSAALLMGAAALATLLYRICTKPSYFGFDFFNRAITKIINNFNNSTDHVVYVSVVVEHQRNRIFKEYPDPHYHPFKFE